MTHPSSAARRSGAAARAQCQAERVLSRNSRSKTSSSAASRSSSAMCSVPPALLTRTETGPRRRADRVHQRADGVVVGDIGGERLGGPARSADGVHGECGVVGGAAVDHGDGLPEPRQRLRDRPSDAGPAARHHGRHEGPPLIVGDRDGDDGPVSARSDATAADKALRPSASARSAPATCPPWSASSTSSPTTSASPSPACSPTTSCTPRCSASTRRCSGTSRRSTATSPPWPSGS